MTSRRTQKSIQVIEEQLKIQTLKILKKSTAYRFLEHLMEKKTKRHNGADFSQLRLDEMLTPEVIGNQPSDMKEELTPNI